MADRGNVLAVYREPGASGGYTSSAAELTGALLHQTRLSAPLNELELIFSVHRLPPGPGAADASPAIAYARSGESTSTIQ